MPRTYHCYARPYPASSQRSHRLPIRNGHPPVVRTTRGTRRRSSEAAEQTRSSVHLPEHDVERPENGRHVRQQMTAAEEVHGLEMGETRGADFALVGLVGAIGDEVDAELPLRGLDGGIGLAGGHVVALGIEL